ncbi:MAG: undecaprenyl-phosphate glucose phosphotransferase [Phycisphaerales bacterium]|nr:undecaprenyl-phosphate glucose phosphotransferase [Phycisphaerales bacterium]
MLKRQHQLFAALLGVSDGVVIALACYAAWAIRRMVVEGFFAQSWENWAIREPLLPLALPFVLTSMWGMGLYRARRDRTLLGEWAQVLKATLVGVPMIVVAVWAVGNREMIGGATPYGAPVVWGVAIHAGRAQFGSLAVLLPLFLCVHRTGVRFILRSARRRGYNLRHVAIVGVGRLGQIVCHTLVRNPWTGLSVAYFISHHASSRQAMRAGLPVRGGLDDLEETLSRHRVDAVYLAIPSATGALLPVLLQRLQKFAVDVRVVPDVQPRFVPQSMVVNELDGMPILSYRENTSTGLGGFSKRVLDVGGSLAAMLLLSPLMLLLGLVVKIGSPGPVIFRQQRVSMGGKVFHLYKFRTMFHASDEEAGSAAWTRRNDPRITPVGRILRRTSLDELPQLFNVLRGEMSLVGPRPERPELISRFREDWRGYMLRQHVKAGITGWAQVNGLRGDTSLRKRVQYDLFYVRHWSLWFDLRILWLTMFRLGRNAH